MCRVWPQAIAMVNKRVTDFGISALEGRAVAVPAGIYYGSANFRRDDTGTSPVDSYTATLNHHFNDAFSVRNTTCHHTDELDRYNTLPAGTTDPVALTVDRTRSFILHDESDCFNQTDFTYKNTLRGLKQEWPFGMELGQQIRRAEVVVLLALSQQRHFVHAYKSNVPAAYVIDVQRAIVFIAIGANLVCCIAGQGASFGALLCVLSLSAAAMAIGLTLTWRPHWLYCLAQPLRLFLSSSSHPR